MSKMGIINRKFEIGLVYSIMALASLSVVIPLTVFKNVAVVFIIYYLGMCLTVPIIDLIIIRKMSFKDFIQFLGFRKGNRGNSILVGVGHGFIFFAFTIVGFFIFKNFFISSDIFKSLTGWGISAASKWTVFFLMILFNGIVEEIFWRGYALGKLKIHLGQWLTIAIVTIFYTSYHLATVLTFFSISYLSIQIVLFIFIAGLVWGWMRFFYNNLWASVIGHTLVTIGYMSIYLLL